MSRNASTGRAGGDDERAPARARAVGAGSGEDASEAAVPRQAAGQGSARGDRRPGREPAAPGRGARLGGASLVLALALLGLGACGEAAPVSDGAVPEASAGAEDAAGGVGPRAGGAEDDGGGAVPFPVEALTVRPCYAFMPRAEVEGQSFTCGTVHIRPDPDAPEAAPARLPVAILRATGPEPQRDPILLVAGAEAAGSTFPTALRHLAARFAPLRVERDVILYDPRGAGQSEPYPDCAELLPELGDEAGAAAGRASAAILDDEAAARCLAAAEAAGMPASGFGADRAAADLAELMGALGYETYNLYAVGGGARVALGLLGDKATAQAVKTLVLDAPRGAPGLGLDNDPALAGPDVFARAFQSCEADPVCAGAYPDALAGAEALLRALDEAPLDRGTAPALNGDALLARLHPYAGAPGHIPYQPRLIAELGAGITDTLAYLESGAAPVRPGEADPIAGRTELLALEEALRRCLALDELHPDSDPNARLFRLYGAPAEEVADQLEDRCGAAAAAAVLDALEPTGPEALDLLIAERFHAQERPDVNPLVASLLACETRVGDAAPRERRAALLDAGLPAAELERALAREAELRARCERLGAEPGGLPGATGAEADTDAQPSAARPVLLLAGGLDPAASPALLDALEARLPDARRVLLPTGTGEALGHHGGCAAGIVAAFLAQPEAPPDESCVSELRLGWLLPDDPLGGAPD